MRRITITIAIVMGISLLSLPVAEACGDKLLRIGRGARFQRSMHPARVLIYVPPNSPSDASARAPKLQAFLKKAGHRSNIADGTDRLIELLGSEQYDVVLTGLDQAPIVQKQIDAFASKPVVVPMIVNERKAEVAAARKRYQSVVKNPNDGDEYLDAIEQAMKSRMRVKA